VKSKNRDEKITTNYYSHYCNNWSFSAKKIATQCKENVDSIGSGLIELEMYGYLRRVKNQSSKGFQTTYFLFFNPTTENPILENPILENPILENPILENPMLGKTLNNSNKEVSKKDIGNKEEREGTALAFFQKKYPAQYEALMLQFKKQINDFVKFTAMFEATVEMEKLEWDCSVLSGRLKKFAFNWISNQGRYEPKESQEVNKVKEKISCI